MLIKTCEGPTPAFSDHKRCSNERGEQQVSGRPPIPINLFKFLAFLTTMTSTINFNYIMHFSYIKKRLTHKYSEHPENTTLTYPDNAMVNRTICL